MAFQVEITPIAEAQIQQAYRWYRESNPEFADCWFRGLMNAIATLHEKSMKGHTPLTSRSHALHGDAMPRGSASSLLVEAEPQRLHS